MCSTYLKPGRSYVQDHPNIDGYFDGIFRPNADGSGGLRVTKVEDERLTAEMIVEGRHLNYMGGLHGGVSATVRQFF